MGRSPMAMRGLCVLLSLVALVCVAGEVAGVEDAGEPVVQMLGEDDTAHVGLPEEVDGIKVSDLRKAVHAAVVKAVAAKNAGTLMAAKKEDTKKAEEEAEKEQEKKADEEDSSPAGQAKMKKDVDEQTKKNVDEIEEKENKKE